MYNSNSDTLIEQFGRLLSSLAQFKMSPPLFKHSAPSQLQNHFWYRKGRVG